MKFFHSPWKIIERGLRSTLTALAVTACMLSGCSDPSPVKSSAAEISESGVRPPANGIPFNLIKKFAVEMSEWHFNSTGDVKGILADAQRLGISFSEEELNNILDEDERKRLWRVGAAEYHIGRLYGEAAQAVFKVRHYVSLAGLWADTVAAAGTLTERKGYIMIVGGNVGIAARVLREVPAIWDCWDVNGCEPRPPMRTPEILLDPKWAQEGDAIAGDLMALSRQDIPDLKQFGQLLERAQTWDIRVCDTLENYA